MNRTSKLVTALGALAIVVGACGGGATPTPAASSAPSAAPSEAASEAPSAAPTLSGDLTVWNAYGSGGTAEGTAFQQILDSSKTQFPNLNIVVLDVPFDQLYTKFETAAASGGGPDLYIAPNDNLGNEVRADLLADVTAQFANSVNFTNTVEVAANGSQIDAKWYMVPESLKAVAMFYRPSKVATPPATTDELLAAVKSGVQFGINQSAYHNWGFWYAFGGQIMDDGGQVHRRPARGVSDAMKFLADMKAAGAKFYTDGAKFQDDFKTGKLDAIIEGPWFSGDAKKAFPDDIAVAPMPAGPTAASQPMTGVDGWYINKSVGERRPRHQLGDLGHQRRQPADHGRRRGSRPGRQDHHHRRSPSCKGFSDAVEPRAIARPQIPAAEQLLEQLPATPSTRSSTRGPTRRLPSPRRAPR